MEGVRRWVRRCCLVREVRVSMVAWVSLLACCSGVSGVDAAMIAMMVPAARQMAKMSVSGWVCFLGGFIIRV